MRGLWTWIIFLASNRYLAFVTRMGIVPFYPELMERFGVSYTGAGALFTAFFVGYAGAMIPAGLLADRRQPLGQMAAGLLLMAGAGLFLPFGSNFTLALAARVVQGIGVALSISAVFKLIAAVFPDSLRGRAVGVVEQATGLGMLTALTVLPWMGQWLDSQVLLTAQPLLCLAPLCLVPLVARRTARDGGGAAGGGPLPPLRQFLRPELIWLTVTTTLGLICANGVLGWVSTYLTDGLGQSRTTAGLVTGLILVGQLAGIYPAGVVSDRIGRRKPVLYVGTAGMALSVLTLLVVSGWALYATALVLGIAMAWAITPMLVLTAEVFGPSRAGLMSSITVASSQVFSGFSGVVFGWLLDLTGGFASIWLAAAALASLRLLTLSLIRERRAAAVES